MDEFREAFHRFIVFQQLNRPFDRGFQRFGRQLQLHQIIDSLHLNGRPRKFKLLITCQNDKERDSPVLTPGRFGNLQAGFDRHFNIGNDNVRMTGIDQFLGLGAIMSDAGHFNSVLFPFQHRLQADANQRLIIGNQQFDQYYHFLANLRISDALQNA
ncbi:hypothetical protein D3C77_400070 [compost metagenome]